MGVLGVPRHTNSRSSSVVGDVTAEILSELKRGIGVLCGRRNIGKRRNTGSEVMGPKDKSHGHDCSLVDYAGDACCARSGCACGSDGKREGGVALEFS